MDEGDFVRQRRNVFVMSLIIIAYCFAEGDIKNITFQGMKLHNEWAIILMVWFGFAYAVFRYHIYSSDAWHNLSMKFYEWAKNKPSLKKEIHALFRAWIDDHNSRSGRARAQIVFSTENIIIETATLFNPKFNFSIGPGATAGVKELPTAIARRIVWKYMFQFAAVDRTATDVLLPYFMAVFAVITAIISAFIPNNVA